MEAMRFLDFLTGFMVCAAAVTFVASWGLKKVLHVLRIARQRDAELEGYLEDIERSRDLLNRAYQALHFEHQMLKNDLPARAPNGRFVKRGA